MIGSCSSDTRERFGRAKIVDNLSSQLVTGHPLDMRTRLPTEPLSHHVEITPVGEITIERVVTEPKHLRRR
jgi:hypothetical protein